AFARRPERLPRGPLDIVGGRRLVPPEGTPVEPEPPFAAIRDGRFSDIPAVRKAAFRLAPVLRRLEWVGSAGGELVLAFDFVVSSDRSLTHEMLSMRDQAFAWLDAQRTAGVQTFQ